MDERVIKLVDNYMQQHIFIPFFGYLNSATLRNSGILYLNAIEYDLNLDSGREIKFRLELINGRLETIFKGTNISNVKVLADYLTTLDTAVKSHYQGLIIHFL